MDEPPFSISLDAELWIKVQLRLPKTVIQLAGLVPVLDCSTGYRVRDSLGRLIEAYESEFVDIGWEHPECVVSRKYLPIDLCGQQVFVSMQTLEALQGTHLELQIVEVGVPEPATKTVDLLIPGPKNK